MRRVLPRCGRIRNDGGWVDEDAESDEDAETDGDAETDATVETSGFPDTDAD